MVRASIQRKGAHFNGNIADRDVTIARSGVPSENDSGNLVVIVANVVQVVRNGSSYTVEEDGHLYDVTKHQTLATCVTSQDTRPVLRGRGGERTFGV